MTTRSLFWHPAALSTFLAKAVTANVLLVGAGCAGVLYPGEVSDDDPALLGDGGTGAEGGAAAATGGGAGAPASVPSAFPPAKCPSYNNDFQPQVHEPVCAHCHGTLPGLAAFSPHAEAQAVCSTIGETVAQGRMPPSNSSLGLSSEQYALVLRWVELGCPETQEQAVSRCAVLDASSASDADQAAVVISRADWNAAKQELRLRGEVADPDVALTAEFGDRSEPLVNDGGRFRQDFNGVAENPGIVRVVTSDGGSAALVVASD